MYYYVVEQLFFIVFFGRSLAQFTTSNLIFHKLCSGDDGNHYLGKLCPNEKEAQAATTVLNTYFFVTMNVCAIIACTVGGYWSDLHRRRKPLLYVPVLGLLICSIVNIVFVHFWGVSATIVAVFNGAMCLFGETSLLYIGGLCYVTDNSPESCRTFRIGILLGAYYISTPIGRGLAGYLNVKYGFINCYLLTIVIFILSLAIIVFCVSEKSKAEYVSEAEKTNSIKKALKFYDKISITSGDKNDSPMEQQAICEHSQDVLAATNEHISRLDKMISEMNGDETEHHLKKSDHVSEIKKDAIITFNHSVNSEGEANMAFENKAFDDTEWKQVPKPKKSKSKNKSEKDAPYDAYVEGKRPPLEDDLDKLAKRRPFIVMAFMSLYENWKLLFQPRANNRTTILVLMVLTSPYLVAPMIVENSVFPLFVRTKFAWTESMYGLFAAFKLSVIVVGIAFTSFILSRKMKVSDAVVGTMASCADTLACLGYILVVQSWQMFLVPILDIFHGSAQIAASAIISKNMDATERGKLFAVKHNMDALLPVVLYPLYNFVYRYTLSYFPAAFFLISAACAVIGIVSFSYICYLQRDKPYFVSTKL
ncbi:hypothetical protein M8J76_005248 [Diaphorina citri]|nr:hypothetical protein M8J76_005248 [Diaphorina citri]